MSEAVDVGRFGSHRGRPSGEDISYIAPLLRRHPVSAVARMTGRSEAFVEVVAKLTGVRAAPRTKRIDGLSPEPSIARRRAVPAVRPAGRAQVWRQSLPNRVRRMIKVVAANHGFTFEDLMGPARNAPVAAARMEAMCAVYDLHKFSLPLIGSWFGGRDHTTVMNAVWRRDLAEQAAFGMAAE